MKGQTSENDAFWHSLSERKFLLQYDACSARYQFYPKPVSCIKDRAFVWQPAVGTGVIVSFTEDRTRSAKPPVILALVQLDEGPRIFAPIIGCRFEDLKIGAKATIDWSESRGYSYQFKLDDGGEQ